MDLKLHLGFKKNKKATKWAKQNFAELIEMNESIISYNIFSNIVEETIDDLYYYLIDKCDKETVYIVTYSVESTEYSGVNLDTINSNITPFVGHIIDDSVKIFDSVKARHNSFELSLYIQEYESYEEAYKVSLDMMEGHKLCYSN